LVVLTARKAAHLLRAESRHKRGGRVAGCGTPAEPAKELDLEELLSREPSPAFAAEVAEECERLLRLLRNRELQAVAVWKMEGYTNEEIAAKLDYAPRSVKRKLQLIRDRWQKELPG
jgi:DNA-directed RNA polymerase specialized sigma24 family protein